LEPDKRERFKDTALQTNAGIGPGEIRQFCPLDQASTNLVKAVMQQMQLSARAYHRTQSVKLARTIANLVEMADIQST